MFNINENKYNEVLVLEIGYDILNNQTNKSTRIICFVTPHTYFICKKIQLDSYFLKKYYSIESNNQIRDLIKNKSYNNKRDTFRLTWITYKLNNIWNCCVIKPKYNNYVIKSDVGIIQLNNQVYESIQRRNRDSSLIQPSLFKIEKINEIQGILK